MYCKHTDVLFVVLPYCIMQMLGYLGDWRVWDDVTKTEIWNDNIDHHCAHTPISFTGNVLRVVTLVVSPLSRLKAYTRQ